jgi:hypothetical protein
LWAIVPDRISELDPAAERCYRPEPFPCDRHRVEYLFALYEQLTAPLVAAAKPVRKGAKDANRVISVAWFGPADSHGRVRGV